MKCSQNLSKVKAYVDDFTTPEYQLNSRIRPLKSFSNANVNCYVKRDDELSFSISGSKIRKYASLIPFIIKKGAQEVIVIGGPHSNNVLGLTQLLIENGVKPLLFLREPGSDKVEGNRLFIEMLVDKSQIRWIPRQEWEGVEARAKEYAKGQNEAGVTTLVIPEGSCMEEAFPGALTLPLDIVRNESEHNIQFDHIFIDAGTGLQAIALILGMHRMEHPASIHVVLLADAAETFKEKLLYFSTFFENRTPPANFQLHRPKISPSFGSVSSGVFQEINAVARGEGFFLDPIYSAKLFYSAREIIKQGNMMGNILIVHTGGGLTLSGFQIHLGAIF